MNIRWCIPVLLSAFAWSGNICLVGSADAAERQALGRLSGTVVDVSTGAPIACTVAITDSTGKTVVERESFKGGFRCNGRFTKELPAGPTRIRVTRGFETRALERVVEIPAGGHKEIKLELERVTDLRSRGWYAGDSHVHMIHGERTIPVTFDDVAAAAKAEDLQYLSLAQDWILESPTPEKLEAELGARSTTNCLLTWNLEAPKNYYRGDAGRCLGHCWNVGVKGRTGEGSNVISLLLEASAHDYQSYKPTFANFESHQLIRDQGGAVFYTHPARWWTGSWGGQGGYPWREKMRVSNMAVELPLDTLLGPSFDGVDVITGSGEFEANAKAFELWCLLLNHGYRVAATASSDSCFDRPGGGTPGVVRAYTFLDRPFSISAVARATAQGRTFVTSGPLLLASMDGQPPGSTFSGSMEAHQLRIEAWASGLDPKGLTRLELLRNGKPIQTNLFAPPVLALSTNLTITERESAWFNVRVFGSDPQRQRAITGAFFIDSKPFVPPAPLQAHVSVELLDAQTGQVLSGSVTEVTMGGTIPSAGAPHAMPAGKGLLSISAASRLRADVPGYRAQVLSPFLDNPDCVKFVTELEADDLLKWSTFERMRSFFGDVKLSFRLEKTPPGQP